VVEGKDVLVTTPFTELVGCELPIQLAGMGMVAGVDLAAAVTNAGGLGTIALHNLSPEELEAALKDLRERTGDRPFGVNFLVPMLNPACLEVAARLANVVEFFYGDPSSALVEQAKQHGALVVWQVGSAPEARQAVEAGADIVVAQGTEAGGHVRGTKSLNDVLPEVLDAVDVPVVAAGGIVDAAGVAAALRAGAHAVRVGTRFLAATEADVHPDYLAAVLAESETVLSETFSVGWPDAPHRVLRSAVENALALDTDTVGEFRMPGGSMPVPRLSSMPPTHAAAGNIRAMALYAGEGVGQVTRSQPAAEIVHELAGGLA
jgi:nitronate monooxygenase